MPTPGTSIVCSAKLSDTILLVGVIDPENVPLIETEIGVVVPDRQRSGFGNLQCKRRSM